MGNQSSCCRSDNHDRDYSFNLRSRKRQRVKATSNSSMKESDMKHSPRKTVAASVKECNELCDAVIQSLRKLPDFTKDLQNGLRKSFASYPEIGPYRYPDGSTYYGQYKNGMRHGYGEQIWKDGSLYQGYFENDKCNGKGRLIHAEGDAYQGDWLEDKASGKGYYIHRDGTT